MRAALNFEDGPDGTVQVGLWLEGPATVSSPAHRAAMTLLKEFESHATRLADPVVTVDPLTQVREGLDQSPLLISR